jgi:hypothetical protein
MTCQNMNNGCAAILAYAATEFLTVTGAVYAATATGKSSALQFAGTFGLLADVGLP